MNRQRFFTWLALAAAVICLAVFAWADSKVVNATTIRVDTSADLRAAVLSYDYSIIEISKDAKINMGTTSLSIPADRTVTLSLDLGSSLDFSSSDQQVNDLSVGIYNLGNLTIAGSGEILMSSDAALSAIYNNGSNNTVTVTGGTLSAYSSNSAYAINNNGSNNTVTVTGGTLSAYSSNRACAIHNGGSNNTVTVTGGTLSAYSSNRAKAINNGIDPCLSPGTVTVLSGDFTGELGEDGALNGSLHGGTFRSYNTTLTNVMIAPGCTSEDIDTGVKRINNCAELSLDAELSGDSDEYKCTVSGTLGTSIDITAALTPAELTSLDAIDKAALPTSLDVTTNSVDKKITVTNNGCEAGTYKVTIVAGNTSNNQAFRVLNIIVPETAIVSTDEALNAALKSATIKIISLDGSEEGQFQNFASFDNLGCAKTIDLNGKTLTLTKSADVNKNLVVYGGTISGDVVFGAISDDTHLTISGDVTVNGKAFGANGGFTSANVTIKNGAQFSLIDGIAAKLQNDQYITSAKGSDDYYTVKSKSGIENPTTSADLAEALKEPAITGIKVNSDINDCAYVDAVSCDAPYIKSLDINGKSLSNFGAALAAGVTFQVTDTATSSTAVVSGDGTHYIFTVPSGATLSIDAGAFKSNNGNYISKDNNGTVKIAIDVKFYGTTKPTNIEAVLSANQMLEQTTYAGDTNYWKVKAKTAGTSADVTDAQSLANAIADINVTNITLSNDIANADTFTVSGSTGNKTIDLNAHSLDMNGTAKVAAGSSLDIKGDGKMSVNGSDYLFTLDGDTANLALESGTFYSESGNYITGGSPEKVTISDDVKFYGSYEQLSDIRDLLADDQILVEGDDGYCTVTTLTGSVEVSDPTALKKALQTPAVTTVTLSNDYTGKISGDITLSGNKTLKLNGKELSADAYTIIVPTGTSLDVNANAADSKITAGANVFSVQEGGRLTIDGTDNGKYETTGTPLFELSDTSVLSIDKGIFKVAGTNGVYFSDSSANITIASQVKFYGAEEPENVKNVLKDTQMLKSVTIGGEPYWEVILKSESPDVMVETSADLDLAVRNDNVKIISISSDIADAKGFTVSTDTGSKTIDLDTHTLSLDSGITITGAVSLDILDGGRLARTTDGYLFTLDNEAKLILESGKFYSPSGDYITGGSKENVTIAEGVQFYFGTDGTKASEFEKYLTDGQKLEKDGDTGWYKVVKSGGTGGSGGGGGCNAGFSFLAFAALALMSAKRKK